MHSAECPENKPHGRPVAIRMLQQRNWYESEHNGLEHNKKDYRAPIQNDKADNKAGANDIHLLLCDSVRIQCLCHRLKPRLEQCDNKLLGDPF